jgi:hypothetical protein
MYVLIFTTHKVHVVPVKYENLSFFFTIALTLMCLLRLSYTSLLSLHSSTLLFASLITMALEVLIS